MARTRVAQLLARLDAEFTAGGEPVYNADHDTWFARYPARFWMFHDCHDETADWLEELGCSVAWAPVRIRLRVAAPDQETRWTVTADSAVKSSNRGGAENAETRRDEDLLCESPRSPRLRGSLAN